VGIEGFDISPDPAIVSQGSTLQFTVSEVMYTNGTSATGPAAAKAVGPVTWTSRGPTTASINGNGLATGISAGTTTPGIGQAVYIVATAAPTPGSNGAGLSSQAQLYVVLGPADPLSIQWEQTSEIPVTGVGLSVPAGGFTQFYSNQIGTEEPLKAAEYNIEGGDFATQPLEFISTNPSVASISTTDGNNAWLTVLGTGTTQIYAYYDSLKSQVITINVSGSPLVLTLSPTPIPTLGEGGSPITITATATVNGQPIQDKFQWEIYDPGITGINLQVSPDTTSVTLDWPCSAGSYGNNITLYVMDNSGLVTSTDIPIIGNPQCN